MASTTLCEPNQTYLLKSRYFKCKRGCSGPSLAETVALNAKVNAILPLKILVETTIYDEVGDDLEYSDSPPKPEKYIRIS